MYIEEVKGGEEEERVGSERNGSSKNEVVLSIEQRVVEWDVKRMLIGAGARALFYPTLLYNVVRNKMEPKFRWWDRVDEFVLLGAVPFPTDVPRLKQLGVQGVITLNEPYETLVPSSLYRSHDIDHLVIPTRDYCFAPSLASICQAVDFIYRNASCGQTTYVHCKAGRGRSTTIVLCYLVQHKQMTPGAAYDYVRAIRPRVLLAASQWQAVQEFYHILVKKPYIYGHVAGLIMRTQRPMPSHDIVAFDDGSVVVVTKADLDGYDPTIESRGVGGEIWADLSVVYRVRVAGKAALTRISCLWLRCRAQQKISGEKLVGENSCLGGFSVDIHVY